MCARSRVCEVCVLLKHGYGWLSIKFSAIIVPVCVRAHVCVKYGYGCLSMKFAGIIVSVGREGVFL